MRLRDYTEPQGPSKNILKRLQRLVDLRYDLNGDGIIYQGFDKVILHQLRLLASQSKSIDTNSLDTIVTISALIPKTLDFRNRQFSREEDELLLEIVRCACEDLPSPERGSTHANCVDTLDRFAEVDKVMFNPRLKKLMALWTAQLGKIADEEAAKMSEPRLFDMRTSVVQAATDDDAQLINDQDLHSPTSSTASAKVAESRILTPATPAHVGSTVFENDLFTKYNKTFNVDTLGKPSSFLVETEVEEDLSAESEPEIEAMAQGPTNPAPPPDIQKVTPNVADDSADFSLKKLTEKLDAMSVEVRASFAKMQSLEALVESKLNTRMESQWFDSPGDVRSSLRPYTARSATETMEST